jgi:hypothetical protein
MKFLLVASVLAAGPLHAEGAILSDPAALAALRAAGPTSAWKGALREADEALTLTPATVMDKTSTPPSGDKHDYYTLGSYYWPDPAKPGGPYINKDGQHNPACDTDAYDKVGWDQLVHRLDGLSAGWALTHDARYAEQAARLARAWFLDPATRMNPHLTYGQVRPGHKGPANGVIETGNLGRLVDSLSLLADSPALSPADQAGLQAWMKAYLAWLQSSWAGQKEAAAANNRGVWYDVQVAALALYTSQPVQAQDALKRSVERLQAQVAADGSLPAELKRTKSFSYSVYDLKAFFTAARLGERCGVDLWGDPRLRQAVAYLAPYADASKDWPYPQIEPRDQKGLAWLLAMGARAWKQDALMKQAVKAGWKDEAGIRAALFR